MGLTAMRRSVLALVSVGSCFVIVGCVRGARSNIQASQAHAPVSSVQDTSLPPLVLDPPPGYYEGWWKRAHAVPADRNAAREYAQAVAVYVDDPDSRAAALVDQQDWDERTRTRVTGWVEQNGESLRLVERATGMPDCYLERHHTFDLKPMRDEPPWVPALRRLAKCVLARGRLRALQGDTTATAADAATLLVIARHHEQQQRCFYQGNAVKIRLMAYGLLASILTPENEADWAAIRQVIEDADAAVQSPAALLPEMMIEQFNWVARYAGDIDGDGRLDQITLPDSAPDKLSPPRTAAELEAEIRDVLIAWDELYALDYPSFERRVTTVSKLSGPPGSVTEALCAPLLLEGCYRRFKYVQYARNWCRAMLCVHAYQSEHGHWPNTLAIALNDEACFAEDPYGETLQWEVRQDCPCLYSRKRIEASEFITSPAWSPPGCARYGHSENSAGRSRLALPGQLRNR